MEEDIIKNISTEEDKHGFESKIENEEFPRGLNEEIIRMISARKEEPEWLLEFRLKAFRLWQTMKDQKAIDDVIKKSKSGISK